MSKSGWDDATYRSRIRDATRRERYAAGSPDAEDIAAYAAGLTPLTTGRALVLGMTPELRALALRHVDAVVAVDASADAIALYRDWTVPGAGQRIELLHADWFSLRERHPGRFNYILGDGIFGNLPDAAAHARLLALVAESLQPDGVFATRMALLPEPALLKRCDSATLIQRFRAGEIDEAEFGLTLRLFGFHGQCFDGTHHLLDNHCVFEQCELLYRTGIISGREHDIVRRYYYSGRNCLLPRADWEAMLTAAGFEFTVATRPTRLWRHYYPVYLCRR